MKWQEMTPEQMAHRKAFVNALNSTGWDVAGWEVLWESGVSLTPEAQAEYQNPAMMLRLGYHAADGFIRLEIFDINQNFAATLRFYAEDPTELLLLIGRWQNTLSPETFEEFTRAAIPLCRLPLLEMPEGLVELGLNGK